jgi:hypothetical protein
MRDDTMWAVAVQNPAISEAVQRIAFSFGYGWSARPPGKDVVQYINSKWLVVTPHMKRIHHTQSDPTNFNGVIKVVNTISEVVELFKNPPKTTLSFNTNVVIHPTGQVSVLINAITSYVFESDKFDELVDKRSEFLGRNKDKKKLAKASFIYTSQNTGRRMRTVLIIDSTETNIRGFDLDESNYKIKNFLKSKIDGGIAFIGYEEPKH